MKEIRVIRPDELSEVERWAVTKVLGHNAALSLVKTVKALYDRLESSKKELAIKGDRIRNLEILVAELSAKAEEKGKADGTEEKAV